METTKEYEVVIVGGGAAGLSAATSAAHSITRSSWSASTITTMSMSRVARATPQEEEDLASGGSGARGGCRCLPIRR